MYDIFSWLIAAVLIIPLSGLVLAIWAIVASRGLRRRVDELTEKMRMVDHRVIRLGEALAGPAPSRRPTTRGPSRRSRRRSGAPPRSQPPRAPEPSAEPVAGYGEPGRSLRVPPPAPPAIRPRAGNRSSPRTGSSGSAARRSLWAARSLSNCRSITAS